MANIEKLNTSVNSTNLQSELLTYESVLKNSFSLNFYDLHPFNPVYIAGFDYLGRRIVVMNAHNANDSIFMDDFLLYFIRKIHKVV